MLFGSADKKAAKDTIKNLNKEFDQIIQSYEMGMNQGDAMLCFFMEQWRKRMSSKEEAGA